MHPNHDTEALLLFAVALASKRRPAELLEVMAAADLINGLIPGQIRMRDAFARLATRGLIVGVGEDGFALTDNGQQLIAASSQRNDLQIRLKSISDNLNAYQHPGDQATLQVSPERFDKAILTHRAAAQSTAKNLLVPKPKTDGDKSRPGQRQRKPMPTRKKRKG